MWTLLSVISNGTDLVFYRRRGTQEGKQFRFLLGDKVKQSSLGYFVSLGG